LSYDLPTTVQKISSLENKKIQLEILKNNEEQAQNEMETKNKLLILEYEKSLSQSYYFQKIYDLKKDTYDKNFNQFKEGILPLDKLIISQNDLLNSEFNLMSAFANIGFSKTKIDINNGF
jgi:OMF family outer membrane factor